MTSGLLETLKEKIQFGGKLFNDLWMSKMSYEEGSYTFEAKHSKKHYLKHSSYVLPVRKILKHSAIAALFKTVINSLDQNIVLFLILHGGVTTRVLNISGQYTILSNVLGTKYDIVYHVLDRNKILFGCLV